ncbi:MAG: prephenate dehydrogenase [Acidimicrobiaceae bacterium]|jgi:prephenate dehydrogenase
MTSRADVAMSDGPDPGSRRRAAVIGTGLIGGSIGLALRARGWHVTGSDIDPVRAARARERGVLDAVGDDPDAEVTFVATPVGAIPAAARAALARGGVVTDVGGVKASVVAAVADPCFVGGHPMAGSEQDGVDGADPTLFDGATWVLTPTLDTDSEAYTRVRSVIRSFGADVVALPPDRHDSLVALVSHVPHLAAATLMGLAADGAVEHPAMLRLVAGGFRDMTRVAAGNPNIWLDICAENTEAILDGLDRLIGALGAMRERVATGDQDALRTSLERSRHARVNLPPQMVRGAGLAEVRVPVPDRPGVVAEITTLLAEIDVNIADLEIAHSTEGARGVLVMVVEHVAYERVRDALVARGFRPSASPLE